MGADIILDEVEHVFLPAGDAGGRRDLMAAMRAFHSAVSFRLGSWIASTLGFAGLMLSGLARM